jgi:hypothetical protein
MFPRLAAVLITVFWVIMWALLIRTELEPDGASLRAVPVEHVLKLMFRHQQPSDLSIKGEGRLIGHLRLLPRILPNDQSRVLDYSGSLQLRLPGAGRQRISWLGDSTFGRDLALRQLGMNMKVHHPVQEHLTDSDLIFAYDAATKKARYELRAGQVILERQEFDATETGLRKLAARSGLDPTVLQTVNVKSETPPKITAQRSSFRIRTEEIETLLLTVEYNEQTMLQVHVSDLGQVIHAKTVLGWTLESD